MAQQGSIFSKIFGRSSKPSTPSGTVPSDEELIHTKKRLFKAQSGIAAFVTALHRVETGFSVNSIADADERERMEFRLNFLRDEKNRILRDNDMSQADLIGREYNSALMVTATNAGDFDAESTLWITNVLEPLIVAGEETIREGRVTVTNIPAASEGTNA